MEFSGKGRVLAKIKAHSLTGRITQTLMLEAFRNVKRNRGAAGIDKVSIKLYESNLLENLLALMRRLKDGTFRPLPCVASISPRATARRGLWVSLRSATVWLRRCFGNS
jgi:RNA-directed DNA polymerase